MRKNRSVIATFLVLAMVFGILPQMWASPSMASTLSAETFGQSYKYIGMEAYSKKIQFSDSGYIVVCDDDYTYGLINIQQEVILPFVYDELYYLTGDLYYAQIINHEAQRYEMMIIRGDGTVVRNIVRTDELYENVYGIGDYVWIVSGEMDFMTLDMDMILSQTGRTDTFYNKNFEEVTMEEVLGNLYTHNRTMSNFVAKYTIDETFQDPDFTIMSDYWVETTDGTVILEPSMNDYQRNYWNSSPAYLTSINNYKEIYNDYYSNVIPFQGYWSEMNESDGTWSSTEWTTYLDYEAGVVYGTLPYNASNINEDGYLIVQDGRGFSFARANFIPWLDGGTSGEPEIHYEKLEDGIQFTSYATYLSELAGGFTLVSGQLPRGLGIYADGILGGVSKEEGTFRFVVDTPNGQFGYELNIYSGDQLDPEAYNDFEILERIPTVESNQQDYVFKISGEFSDFIHVYLNGEQLIRDVQYLAEEGSTKIVVLADTVAQLNSGSHTINATFSGTNVTVSSPSSSATTSGSTSTGSQKVAVASVAQTFQKTEPASTEPVLPFNDVLVTDWFYPYVKFVYENKTFLGISDSTYEPETGMTRAMMAVTLYALANKPATEVYGYVDLEDTWYTDAVNWVGTRGIDDRIGNFSPHELITREDTAKMMYNFCVDQGIFLPMITSKQANDLDYVSDTARNAVNMLFQQGIFSGDLDDNFNPQNTSTRAEIAAVMKTFITTCP